MSKSSELDQTAKQYIIDNINHEYCEPESDDINEVIDSLRRAFYAEYGWRVDKVGEQKALVDWFMGLPSACSIEFMNHKILDMAIAWGSLPADYTEKQADKILGNWFNFIAAKTGQLFRGYHVPKQ